jgi:hypothetical protein
MLPLSSRVGFRHVCSTASRSSKVARENRFGCGSATVGASPKESISASLVHLIERVAASQLRTIADSDNESFSDAVELRKSRALRKKSALRFPAAITPTWPTRPRCCIASPSAWRNYWAKTRLLRRQNLNFGWGW